MVRTAGKQIEASEISGVQLETKTKPRGTKENWRKGRTSRESWKVTRGCLTRVHIQRELKLVRESGRVTRRGEDW